MPESTKTIEDPVCGMTLEKPQEYTLSYKGNEYHFCSSACKHTFETSPDTYAKTKAA